MKEKLKDKRTKSEEEFIEYLQEIEGDLYRIAKTRLLQDEDIYDAIQEASIISYNEYVKRNKGIENFKAWIICILINECNHIYKKQKKQINLYEKELMHNREDINQIEDIDNEISFEQILSSLKYEDRLIMNLYYGSKFTYSEISKILKKNENTIKTRISRAKKRIQIELERRK